MANGNGDGLQNAGISPKERLERIEAMLTKIDEKLDTKANAAEVSAMEARLRMMEIWRVEHTATTEQRFQDHTGQDATFVTELSTIKGLLDGVRRRVWMAVGGLSVLVLVVNVGIAKGWF